MSMRVVDTAEPVQQARHSKAKLAWVSSTYFAEGLPYSIVHQLTAQLFTALNASLPVIGMTSLYGLAWNFKFLWSPLVDRFGSIRQWMVVFQGLLALSIGLAALPAQQGHLATVAIIMVVVAVLAATHDVAIDGFYLSALNDRSQANYAGLRIAAYRLSLLFGNGVLVWVGGRFSWRASFLIAGAVMGALTAFHWLVLPYPNEKRKRAAVSSVKDFIHSFWAYFRSPNPLSAVLFILFYRAGDALLFSMSSAFLRDLSLDTSMRGKVSGIGGTIVSILGAMAAGAWVARKGLAKTLVPITLIQAGALPIYVLLAITRPSLPFIVPAVLVEHLAAGVGTAGFSVFLMRRCSSEHKAAHFAIGSALMSVAATGCGTAGGFLAQWLGYGAYFVVACFMALPGIILAFRLAPTLALRERTA
jgi:PAT family beta-lactamase induction signal transducer AmpG